MKSIISLLPLLQAEGQGGSIYVTLIMFVLIILVFYFLIIRPQSKKQKDMKMMLEAIKKNDKIVTIGGIRGVVSNVKSDTIIVKVDDNTKLEFSKNAVSSVLNTKTGEVKGDQATGCEIKDSQVK